MVASPYHSAARKIKQARKHLRTLENELADYSAEITLEWKSVGPETEGQHKGYYKHTVTAPPIPDDVDASIADCLHNLRTALDHMVSRTAILYKVNPNTVSFPFSESKEEFEKILAGTGRTSRGVAKLPKRFLDILRRCRPFKGGFPLLRDLSDFDNADKHYSLAEAVPVTTRKLDEDGLKISVQLWPHLKDQLVADFLSKRGATLVFSEWYSQKPDPSDMPPGFFKEDVAPEIRFRTGGPYGGFDVLRVVPRAIDQVANVLKAFEQEAARP